MFIIIVVVMNVFCSLSGLDSIIFEVKSLLHKSNIPHAVFYTSDKGTIQHSTISRRPRRSTCIRGGDYGYNSLPKCYSVKDEFNSSCVLFCFTSPIIEIWEGNVTTTVYGDIEKKIRYERG